MNQGYCFINPRGTKIVGSGYLFYSSFFHFSFIQKERKKERKRERKRKRKKEIYKETKKERKIERKK